MPCKWNGQGYVPPAQYKTNRTSLITRALDAGIKRIVPVSPTTIDIIPPSKAARQSCVYWSCI